MKINSDIFVVHPYKHHAFNLAAGCSIATNRTSMSFPLYLKGAAIALKYFPGSIGKRASGYFYEKLDSAKIYSPIIWQLRKLHSFLGHPRDIEKYYDRHVADLISSGRIQTKVLVTLQDHMTQSISVAKSLGIKVWSDQIVNMSESAQSRISHHCEQQGITYKWWDESRNNVALRNADIVTVPSQYVLDGISDRINFDAKIKKIPYGVDVKRFNIQRNVSANEILVVVRANSVRKGGHLIIEALKKCGDDLYRLANEKSVTFYFLGVVEDELKSAFLELSKNSKCRICEANLPHTAVPSLLSRANLFVMPTLSEGMSLAIPEAMAAAMPVITTPYSGVDVFKNEQMGLLIMDDVDSIANGLISAFKQFDAWESWGNTGMRAIVGSDWSRYESDISALANAVVGALK